MRDDPPTVLLGRVGTDPLRWPTVDPDTPAVPPPDVDVMRRALAALRAWGTAPCALCGTEPVVRPDLPRGTVDGRFCGGCIARCLDDPRGDHWCPIDTLGAAGG
ncbi:hypothetical protein [Saccharomonospora iraqiensis]|uniref:hypothetical protein n=1 Tax=Saccharomonospora iraqiensis TaxID=52698 RepID=UPI00022E207E|nr:hypothetical protein [Saccharomonospora iraqiensis]